MSFFLNFWNLFPFRINMSTNWFRVGREDSDDSWDLNNRDTFKDAEDERTYVGDDIQTYWEKHYFFDVREEREYGGPTPEEAYKDWEQGWMSRRRELYLGDKAR